MNNIQYATFWQRMIASVLDKIILIPLILISYWGYNNIEFFDIYYIIPSILFNVWFTIYLVKRYGGTPGKLIMKIKIIKQNNTLVGYKEAILRELITLLLTSLLSILNIIIILNIQDNSYSYQSYFGNIEYYLYILLNIWIISEFFIMLTNKKKQSLQDMMAGTIVIKNN